MLDVGCGSGVFGEALKKQRGAEVTGLTYSEDEAAEARLRMDRVIFCDLNRFEAGDLDLGLFDCIVCSHVLEHCYWPDEFLLRIRPLLAPKGRLIVALPNIPAWRQRFAFLCGRFRYTDGGLMDRTHFRFYDQGSAQELVTQAGYDVDSARAEGVFPLASRIPVVGTWINGAAVRVAPGLFAFQFVITARSKL